MPPYFNKQEIYHQANLERVDIFSQLLDKTLDKTSGNKKTKINISPNPKIIRLLTVSSAKSPIIQHKNCIKREGC